MMPDYCNTLNNEKENCYAYLYVKIMTYSGKMPITFLVEKVEILSAYHMSSHPVLSDCHFRWLGVFKFLFSIYFQQLVEFAQKVSCAAESNFPGVKCLNFLHSRRNWVLDISYYNINNAGKLCDTFLLPYIFTPILSTISGTCGIS